MTKVEQLKARAYAINIFEEKEKQLKDQIEYTANCIEEAKIEGVEPSIWDLENLEETKRELQMVEYVIEEIAK